MNTSLFTNTTNPKHNNPNKTNFLSKKRHLFIPYLSTRTFQQDTTTPNPFTKIDELERGGKFQRLRLVPADTLIECKENDFGLECSCSITLSPPKCKQLINSFLSSCRILGCKNNGKCINMAYKYPIPYVCSCPSTYMGSYCEISRETGEGSSSENDSPIVPPILTPILRSKTESGVRSAASGYSSAYKLFPTQGAHSSKEATTKWSPTGTTPATTTRFSEFKSRSSTFDLSMAVFSNKMTTSMMPPKARKTFTTSDFEVYN